MRFSFFLFFSFSLTLCSQSQEFELSKRNFDNRAKLAIVTLSAKPEVELEFPEGFVGQSIQGRVALVNDGAVVADISEAETSCGCTSAIPVSKSVKAGEHSFLLINYSPKAAGEKRVEAAFTFGGKKFYLSGIAKTKPRFQQTTSVLTRTPVKWRSKSRNM